MIHFNQEENAEPCTSHSAPLNIIDVHSLADYAALNCSKKPESQFSMQGVLMQLNGDANVILYMCIVLNLWMFPVG